MEELEKLMDEVKDLISESERMRERIIRIKNQVADMYSSLLYVQVHDNKEMLDIQEKIKGKIFYVRSTCRVYEWRIIVEQMFDLNGELIGNPVDEVFNPYVKTYNTKTGHKLLEGIYGGEEEYKKAYQYHKLCYIDIDRDRQLDDDITAHIIFDSNNLKTNELDLRYLSRFNDFCDKIDKKMNNVEYKEKRYNEAVKDTICFGLFKCLHFGLVGINAMHSLNKTSDLRMRTPIITHVEKCSGIIQNIFDLND